MKRRWIQLFAGPVLAICFIHLVTSPALCDEVEDSIREAEERYKSGDYNETIKELQFTIQLLRKKKSEQLREIFPPPLSGWDAKEPDITASGPAVLGGGIQAKREYTRKGAKVVVEIILDNPFLQGILSIVDSPLLLDPGAEPIRISGNRAHIVYDAAAKEGELKLVYRKKALVSVRGYRVETADPIRAYATGIQFELLKNIVGE